ncbi:unnamed protein product [Spirodela intermedia]|uniref:TFIIS N-terminal domain-containing protein n=1 Tax=Spirodela intermedia TaxID=51605 RepID=A0A7I8JCE1_SPIIN|nr:unnamed protein product [Spirodela intermedia]CAA6667651.1 unnamed protein product [Spirodela intermedia]
MNTEEFEKLLRRSGLDLWTLIETAISVAARDHGKELRLRRDGIVERLYRRYNGEEGAARASVESEEDDGIRSKVTEAEMDDLDNHERTRGTSPSSPQSPYRKEEEEEEEDNRGWRPYGRPFEDEQSKILAIKDHLHDPDQSDESLVHMLHTLADMDLTFKALKGTDVGRHVNGLRKHPSSEVRRLVKNLVRKWKDLVDDWVKSNSSESATSTVIPDGDSPKRIQARSSQNGNQVPDFGYSPNPRSGSSVSDKTNSEGEMKSKIALPPRKETPAKPKLPTAPPPSSSFRAKEDSLLDPERLASAKRRLHENYQEAENAKKQRTIQVVDIHDVPKPKGSFSGRHKPGFQAKHW